MPEDILVVRRGPGANCSSVGSVVDILFVSTAVASGVIAAACALAARGIASSQTDEDRKNEHAERPPPERSDESEG